MPKFEIAERQWEILGRPKLDKVIMALECCDDYPDADCDHCPYMDDVVCGTCHNASRLLCDVLYFLKGHVMTTEEVEAVEQQELVWVELRRTDALYAAIREGNDFTTVGNDDYFMLGEVTDCPDYLRWYRFWSAQPSEERRHETPWEDTDG